MEGRATSWARQMDQLRADANAYSIQQRGRDLPAPNGLGQLPAQGVQITRQVGGQEAGGEEITTITAADVTWQNLANKIEDTRAAGASALETLRDNLNAQLDQLRREQRTSGPTAPSQQPGKDPQKIAPWVEFMANVVAYGLVFWGLTIAAHSLNFWNVFVIVALLALTFLLGTFIVRPLAQGIIIIFGAIIQILQDVVDFITQWINGVIQYFQGDFIRALLQILEVAAFMYLWQFALRIPVIGQLVQWVTDGIRTVVGWVNGLFDQITHFLETLRHNVDDQIEAVFGTIGDTKNSIVQLLQQTVDRIFGNLESRLASLRFELLSKLDVITQALGATINVFGYRLTLVPEEVRRYLINHAAANPVQQLTETPTAIYARAPFTPSVVTAPFGPWDALDEVLADLRTARVNPLQPVQAVVLEVVQDLSATILGTPPDVPNWDPNIFQLPGTPTAPTAPPLEQQAPAWMPADDWAQVLSSCPGGFWIAYLAAAIGWHETNWGRVGAGRDGYHLGVGVTAAGEDPAFQGLAAQLGWACPRLAAAFPTGSFGQAEVIAFGANVYRVPDPVAWGTDVYQIYVGLTNSLQLVTTA